MPQIYFHPAKTKKDAVHSFFAFDPYIEAFWLPILGPTATLLINILSIESIVSEKSFLIDANELSLRVGTGNRTGQSSPIFKQLSRLCRMGLIFESSQYEFLIPQAINPLDAHSVKKLSAKQRLEHDLWINRLEISPLSTQRRRLRLLLTRLETMGYADSKLKQASLASGLHPSIINEAIAASKRENNAA